MSAPEADDVLEAPDDVIAADGAEQEHIQGEGGGTDVAVPENESAEQASVRRIGRVVEIAVAVHEEQKHVSVSQVGAGRNPFSAEDAVLVAERQGPGRVLGHEVEHPAGQLVVVDPRAPRRGDRVDGPRFVAVDEELVLLATLTAQPVVDRIEAIAAGSVRRYFGGAAAMPASCSKLQFVRAAWRPDVSRSASASDATASVLSATVSMVRSSVRRRRARAAS